jgi:hypothetical protein
LRSGLDLDVVAGVADAGHVRGAHEQVDAADVREAERNAAEDAERGVGGRQPDDLRLAGQARRRCAAAVRSRRRREVVDLRQIAAEHVAAQPIEKCPSPPRLPPCPSVALPPVSARPSCGAITSNTSSAI